MSGNFDPKQVVMDKINQRGGFVNTHAHIDRAFILNEDNFKLVDADLKTKWNFPDEYKKNASVDIFDFDLFAIVFAQSFSSNNSLIFNHWVDINKSPNRLHALANHQFDGSLHVGINVIN